MAKKKPVDPFAFGKAFVKQWAQLGWMKKGVERGKHYWYLTTKGAHQLLALGIRPAKLYIHAPLKRLHKRLTKKR